MSVTGIEKLEFGVEDLTHCAKFMRDFGLTGDASGQRFTTLSGARVELNPIDSPDLPPAFEAGNTLRRMTWAVASQSDLDALRPKLAQQPGFREVGTRWNASIRTAWPCVCRSASRPTLS